MRCFEQGLVDGGDGLFGLQAANGGPHVGIQKESWNPSAGFCASSMAVHLALLQTFHFLCKLHFDIVTSSYVQIIRSHAAPFLRAVLGTHFAATAAQKSQRVKGCFPTNMGDTVTEKMLV